MNSLSNTLIFLSLPSHIPSWKSGLNNTLATVKKATPDPHPTTQTYLFPTSQLDVGVYLFCKFPCLLLKWSSLFVPQAQPWICQGPLWDITSHQAFPNMQISNGLKGSQEQSFSERTALKHKNHHDAPETRGSLYHLLPGHRPAAPPRSYHEHNSSLIKQRIKSSLGGKPR